MSAIQQNEGLAREIPSYFERMGWSFEELASDMFRTRVQGKTATFTLLVKVTEHWIVFSCNPFIAKPHNGWGPTAMRFMATSNHGINLFKLGIDRDEDLFLVAELPARGFIFRQFEECVSALAHYCNELYVPIMQAIQVDRLNGHAT